MVPDLVSRADDKLCGITTLPNARDVTVRRWITIPAEIDFCIYFSYLFGYSPPASLGQEHGGRYA